MSCRKLVNSWISQSQIIWQWISDCWSGNRKCMVSKHPAANM